MSSAPVPGLPLPQNLSASVTRILHLSGFPPELKTRDIHSAFQVWENDKGGFKIKWIDDTSALVVFNDAVVAKRAYLQTLLTPPAVLVSPTSTLPLQIRPYDGPDAQAIIQNVNARTTGPPSRQNSQNAHQSRAPFSVSPAAGTGHIRAASMAAAIPSVGGHAMSSSMSLGQLGGSAASRWAPKGDGSTPPALPEIPYQAPLGAMINGSGSALATSPAVEEAPVQGGARIGDAGRRMVAGALGVRHPSLRRNSPPTGGSEITA
ncbi:hypothetical protein DACRYDRAFT_101130 [Dacryopinax primogenitus]|uniref:Uncharacterized protein n=1 Tax=Dacryopinax primogenitus (strain DJM 731) TaxID=1858805 RepID=M5G2I4_DACPD|nr:uncharacterized protein DACRYDRAFT_101130 [Dacryopinax primogenitus]EJU00067.1 hypothetical protein DACRYDRAFT_101130 [Dacryopinax primogenitus]